MGLAGSIEHTLEVIGDTEVLLIISRPVTVLQSIEVPANVDLRFLAKGRLVLGPGVALSILGQVFASPSQWIFEVDGDDSVILAPRVDTVSPHWWGAIGDGWTNDTRAIRLAADFINRRGGGTISFVPAIYIVGMQHLAGVPGAGCSYCADPILRLEGNSQKVIVRGNGATLRAQPGLRFGSFDPVTGEPVDPLLPFFDRDFAASAYAGMIELTGNADVEVRDFELDGNIGSLLLGGFWGDTGRQLGATGVRAINNRSVEIRAVHTHHHGLDGITVGFEGLQASDPPTPHLLVDVVSEYNARQGLSWVGGIGLTARHSRFSHTGRARFSSAPSAGLDIEAEDSVVRDGLFEDCEFINNAGLAVVADSGDGGYTTFRRSLFWGTTTYVIWPNKPQMRFEDSTIHGTVVRAFQATDPADGVVFTGCEFDDLDHPTYGVFTSPAGLLELDADHLLIENSRIIAHSTRGVFLDGTSSRETLRNVVIEHRFDGLASGDFQSLLRGVKLEHVEFRENFPTSAVQQWYIAVEAEDCNDVFVLGPRVRWKNPVSGPTGQVCP